MKAETLKKSILQYAMQGKLVAQNPDDEPASELLKRIKAEKEKLIKEGKIKKEKPLPPITEEEIPHELPQGWEWVRLGEIITVKGGKRIPKGKNFAENPTQHIYIRVTDMKNNSIIDTNLKYISDEIYDEIKAYTISSDDLYLTIAGTIGNVGIVPKKFNGMNLTENAVKLQNIPINKAYLMRSISSIIVQCQFVNKTNQLAQPKLAIQQILTTIIPLPPLAEQQRIVEKLEQILPLIEEYGKNEEKLSELNQTLPDKIKQSVLQYAVQGKLVPQNPKDEPASELLKRIKAEKEKLIKEGKIKREKPLPPITEEEIPHELPQGWEWVRLGNLIELTSGQDLTPNMHNDEEKGIPYITGASNIANGQLIINRWTTYGRAFAYAGNLLLTCKGTVGTMFILDCAKVHIARQIMGINTLSNLSVKYTNIFLETYINNLKSSAKSIIPGISRNDVLEIAFPLPPLAEQQRIVEKLEQLLPLIEELG